MLESGTNFDEEMVPLDPKNQITVENEQATISVMNNGNDNPVNENSEKKYANVRDHDAKLHRLALDLENLEITLLKFVFTLVLHF
jgi:hypothetical protein